MKRIDFLRTLSIVPAAQSDHPFTSSLEEWVPSARNPWDQNAAMHLYGRLGFGASRNDLIEASNKTFKEIILALLDPAMVTSEMPEPPKYWEDWLYRKPYLGPDPDIHFAEETAYANGLTESRNWWVALMANDRYRLREKLTLFWSNHFVVQDKKVYHTPMTYRFNELLRSHAWGNFKTFAKAVTIHPAMLVYLDGVWSEEAQLNENFAREMLELFVVGRIDKDGKETYTQHDVREVAHAVTGWRFNYEADPPTILPAYFAPYYFDFQTRRSPFDAEPKVYGLLDSKDPRIEADILELIFERRAKEIAFHICRKLYRFFVYNDESDPRSLAVIEELAALVLNENWELRPVLEKLFLSAHFFDRAFRGSRIKSPIEYGVALTRHFNQTLTDWQAGSLCWYSEAIGQRILFPRTVKGWPEGRDWVNSGTLSWRTVNLAGDMILSGATEGRDINPRTGNPYDPLTLTDEVLRQWAFTFEEFEQSLPDLIRQMSATILVIAPTVAKLNAIIAEHEKLDNEWPSLPIPIKLLTLRKILARLTSLPQYQLT